MKTESAKQTIGAYAAPTIDVIAITTEKGFATSHGDDYTTNPGGDVYPMDEE